MAEKKITIELATVGAAESAAGVDKTTAAVTGLTAAENQHTESTEKAATASRQDTQIGIQRAQMAGKVAEGINKMGEAVRAAAEDFKDADPELAQTFERIGDGLETVGNMAQYAASGFMIAGPAGAAAGAAIGAVMDPISKAYKEMLTSMEQNAAAHKALDNFEEDLAANQAERASRMRLTGTIKLLEDQEAAARKLTEEMSRLDKVEAARARLTASERDREDAAALDQGKDPAEVKKARIQKDAADERARLEAEIENKAAIAREAQKAVWAADDVVAVARQEKRGDKAIAEAEAEAKAARDNLSRAGRDFNDAYATGPYRRATINSRERGAMENLDRAANAKRDAMNNEHAEANIEMGIRQQQEADRQAKAAADQVQRLGGQLVTTTAMLGGTTERALAELLKITRTALARITTLEALAKNQRKAGQ